jgi:hypothetical protein
MNFELAVTAFTIMQTVFNIVVVFCLVRGKKL